ncbi:hypothetical protein [Streptomyces sp. H27-C3]|uniref:hypothetical protein n=1 Tax=Streptomyces sp. H27-C3 TaxID=3046305 RepID=UPI0024B97E20|nr:hypothetical protein [Streptomyces sp. H27-C3]MDJ0461556.1 hypothetical protein [Streptomyces sp. H27-C3]
MATTSRVPAALNALLTILRAAPALAATHIEDGPPGVNLTDRHRLYIGWSPSGDQAVDLQQSFASAGARTRDESFTITCYAESRAGDKDMALRRTQVFEIVAAVEAALRATDAFPEAPTLLGAVLWSELTTGSLTQEQGSDGALAGLVFSVSCRARI